MALRFSCPKCGFDLSAPESCAGRSSKCRQCGQPVTVPVALPAPPVALPAPPVAILVQGPYTTSPTDGHQLGSVPQRPRGWLWIVLATVSVAVMLSCLIGGVVSTRRLFVRNSVAGSTDIRERHDRVTITGRIEDGGLVCDGALDAALLANAFPDNPELRKEAQKTRKAIFVETKDGEYTCTFPPGVHTGLERGSYVSITGTPESNGSQINGPSRNLSDCRVIKVSRQPF